MTAATLRIWRARQVLQLAVHQFFNDRQFLSIDTPILVTAPGTEVYLNYFDTTWVDHRLQEHTLYLRSSPELHLKQALAMGADRVYHLGKCFRNEGEYSRWHHPEFTMLEWYQTGIGYQDFMTQTEEFLRYTASALRPFQGALSFEIPARIPRLTVAEAFERFTGIPLQDQDTDLATKGLAKGMKSLQPQDDFETAFFKLLLDYVEPGLAAMGCVFLMDYPASQAALAKVENGVARRFELYVNGVELCNAFQELTGAEANRQRIQEANLKRSLLGKPMVPDDDDFMAAMTQGLPECCGNALGFDRWLSLLTGASFDQTIPFRRGGCFQREIPS